MIHDEFDPCKEAVINPPDCPIEGFPEICIGVFSYVVVEQLVKKYHGEVILEVPYCTGSVPIYKIKVEETEFALTLPHVGAPAAIAFMENMIPAGGRHFVFFGSCGVLRHDIADGHLIVPAAAIRDEGISYHYVPAADEIELDPACVEATEQAMEFLGLPYVKGKTWTTDAFYRETEKKMKRRKEQGCVCVEMECAALAAVAQFRGVHFASFFYAADNLDAPQWDARGLHLKGASVAEKCVAAALETGRRLSKIGKDTNKE